VHKLSRAVVKGSICQFSIFFASSSNRFLVNQQTENITLAHFGTQFCTPFSHEKHLLAGECDKQTCSNCLPPLHMAKKKISSGLKPRRNRCRKETAWKLLLRRNPSWATKSAQDPGETAQKLLEGSGAGLCKPLFKSGQGALCTERTAASRKVPVQIKQQTFFTERAIGIALSLVLKAFS
jgi:hypothetical protein